MPVYEFACSKCKSKDGREKVFEVFKPFSQSGDTQHCPDCSTVAGRVYSFSRTKEFTPFFDEQFQTVISSTRQEEKLMKEHGKVFTQDTPAYKKFKSQINRAHKKPYYFIPGVKSVKIDRD